MLLARWTAIFPLSTGPAERVHRHVTGTGTANFNEGDLDDVIANYVREVAGRVPATCTVDADGNLLGPKDFTADPGDVLFRAVFTTDLDAVLAGSRTREPVIATAAAGE